MSINTLPDPANQNQSGDFSEVLLQGINFFCSLIFHALFQSQPDRGSCKPQTFDVPLSCHRFCLADVNVDGGVK